MGRVPKSPAVVGAVGGRAASRPGILPVGREARKRVLPRNWLVPQVIRPWVGNMKFKSLLGCPWPLPFYRLPGQACALV